MPGMKSPNQNTINIKTYIILVNLQSMNKNIKVGSIFSVKVSPNEKIFGRVLFNVDDYLYKS